MREHRLPLWVATFAILLTAHAGGQSPLERLEAGLGGPPPNPAAPLESTATPPPVPGGQPDVDPTAVVIYLGLAASEDEHGIRVESVVPDGPASRAGILPGNRITSVAGQQVARMADFARVLAGLKPGDVTEFGIQGRREGLVVTVAAAPVPPDQPVVATDTSAPPGPASRAAELIEARIRALEHRVKVLELRILELEAAAARPAAPAPREASS